MTSKNYLNYSQPSFYRFNEDSILLAKFTAQRITSFQKGLELGAGSGVVSIELLNILKMNLPITLLEMNSKFEDYLKSNIKELPYNEKIKYLITNWNDFNDRNFDLILSNPPYFLVENSRESLNKDRDLCRRWSEACEMNFYKHLDAKLDKNGNVFLCLRKSKLELEEVLMSTSLKIVESEKHNGMMLFHLRN
tara:strand:- start:47187 stop:47765 length:579 start_codon:yes stop_codon:yes gene_type:complete